MGYNALTYTYMVELWPFAERAYGITVLQLFGRLATFFSTFVNPIGLDSIGWKYLTVYVAWLAYENVFVYLVRLPITHHHGLVYLADRSIVLPGDVRPHARGASVLV
jgi:hypothetical protein